MSMGTLARGQDTTIEALRGLAAVMVVATHYVPLVNPQPGLWGLASTGVDLFFVLSGFVFAPYFQRADFDVGAHLLRRLLRIYPLYAVALLAYALLKPDEAHHWDALPAHLLMAHTLGTLETAAFYNPAFWSLPPELEFYIALPLLAALTARLGLLPVVAVALLAKALLVLAATPGEALDSARSIATIHLPGLLIEFLMGVAAARWAQRLPRGRKGASHTGLDAVPSLEPVPRAFRPLLVFAMLAASLCLAYAGELSDAQAQAQAPLWLRGTVGLWAAAAYACLVAGLVGGLDQERTGPSPGLGNGPGCRIAQWAGRLSFGVYLLHNAAPTGLQRAWPELQGWSLLAASVAATLGAAAVLHVLVEDPCRQFGRRLAVAVASGGGRG